MDEFRRNLCVNVGGGCEVSPRKMMIAVFTGVSEAFLSKYRSWVSEQEIPLCV